jgi:hypothetical protein
MLIAAILESAHQNYREAAQFGDFLGYPGRIQTGLDQAVAYNADIRIIPIPAEIGLGFRVHPAYFGVRTAGNGNQQGRGAENQAFEITFHVYTPSKKMTYYFYIPFLGFFQ